MMPQRRPLAVLVGSALLGLLLGALSAHGASVYQDGYQLFNGCWLYGIVAVEDPPVSAYSDAGTYAHPQACPNYYYAYQAATWPWTGSQYVGYTSTWQGDPGAFIAQYDYDTTRSYGYHQVQLPAGNYSATLELYVSQ